MNKLNIVLFVYGSVKDYYLVRMLNLIYCGKIYLDKMLRVAGGKPTGKKEGRR